MKKLIYILLFLLLFTSCEVKNHTHKYDYRFTNEYTFKEGATCTHGSIYYKSCSCGDISSTDTYELNDKLDHIFTEEVVSSNYLASAATCTSKAKYYYSCSCGEASINTFEYGELGSHVFDRKNTDSEFLKSQDSTTATYYYSCLCGEKSQNTFSVSLVKEKKSGTVNIFEINDTHGASFTDEETGIIGLDKVQTFLSNNASKNYIKVANGDVFQGEYVSNKSYGRVFIDIFNEMDFDCVVIGNHDFDWGFDKIAQYRDGDESNGELDCPMLGCNIIDKSTGKMPSFLDEYVIVERNGLKVGIIGCIGGTLESSIAADKIAGYEFLDPVPIIERISSDLRLIEGCDIVVVSIHEYDTSTNEDIADLSGDSLIDGIICGHTHQSISEYEERSDGYNIPVVQSYTKNKNVGSLTITISNGVATSGSSLHYNVSSYACASSITALKVLYSDIIDASTGFLGYTSSYLSKYDMGQIMCNAMNDLTGSCCAFINISGVRDTISQGYIKEADLLAVFPFENKIYYMNVSGKTLKKFYNTYVSNNEYLYCNDSFKVSSISDSKTYTISIIDFIYNKSAYQNALGKPSYTDTGVYMYDCIKDYIIENYN